MSGSLSFDGLDQLKVGLGNATVTDAATFLFVLRPTEDDGSETYLSSEGNDLEMGRAASGDGGLYFISGGKETDAASAEIPAVDEWQVLAFTRAAGLSVPRAHKVPLPTGTALHEDLAGTTSDQTAAGYWLIGNDGLNDSYGFVGQMAAIAVWKSALTDAQVEECTTLAALEALNPDLLVPLDGEAPFDGQLEIVGTEHSELGPEGWLGEGSATVKVWTGITWKEAIRKVWTGTEWVTA